MIRRVLYAATSDPLNVRNWSGTVHHIYKALDSVFEEVEPWQIPLPERPFSRKLMGKVHRRLSGAIEQPDTETWLAETSATEIQKKLSQGQYDAVFSHAPRVFGNLGGDIPVFAWTDAVFPNLINYYPGFDRVREATKKEAMETEQRGIARCRKFFVSSDWALEATEKSYHTPPGKVISIPFGANLPVLPSGDVSAVIQARRNKPVKLLFLGVDWVRKGGDIAVECVKTLHQRNVDAQLIVVGCAPPDEFASKPWLVQEGFLDKRKPEEQAKLLRLLDEAKVLLMPTRAEALGIAVLEGYCRAVPAVAAATGGLTSLVSPETGKLVAYEAGGQAYAEAVQEIVSTQESYENLCASAYKKAVEQFTWEAIARRLFDEVQSA